MNHYFDSNENLAHKQLTTKYAHKSEKFEFVTDIGVFSRNGVDRATDILLSCLPALSGKTLDFGCGFGVVGIVLSKLYGDKITVFMSDVNNRALELARANAEKNKATATIINSDGFFNIPENFDAIIQNPPIHAGKAVVYRLYEEAHGHLAPGGSFFVVVLKKHGALSHKKKLEELFGDGNCFVLHQKKGIFVFECRANQK
ncbi:MAG: methyltransferase [Oscillospiraceae bacterium]|nr:methyltransferase [Oscillospiraceae bacterium]